MEIKIIRNGLRKLKRITLVDKRSFLRLEVLIRFVIGPVVFFGSYYYLFLRYRPLTEINVTSTFTRISIFIVILCFVYGIPKIKNIVTRRR